VVGVALALVVMVGVGLLWGAGVVIGSFVGSTLPGTGGDGVAAMLRSFPDVGQAWDPPIRTGLVWGAALLVVASFGPLVVRLVRAGRLADDGAQWATKMDLRRAGLLVPDRELAHAEEEEPSDAS
jgi:hypothetical protein